MDNMNLLYNRNNIFSCDSSSISRNVGLSVGLPATRFIEVLCCCQCMNVVTVVVVYDIKHSDVIFAL